MHLISQFVILVNIFDFRYASRVHRESLNIDSAEINFSYSERRWHNIAVMGAHRRW